MLDDLPEMPWKYKLAFLVYQFSKLDQTECPVIHIFEGDKYIREMYIPAGTLFIGRTHNHGHIVELVSGDVLNISENSREEITQPFKFKSSPGYQAVFYAITDVIGRTVHENPDGVTDWKVLEDRDFDSVQALIDRGKMVEGELCLEQQQQ